MPLVKDYSVVSHDLVKSYFFFLLLFTLPVQNSYKVQRYCHGVADSDCLLLIATFMSALLSADCVRYVAREVGCVCDNDHPI